MKQEAAEAKAKEFLDTFLLKDDARYVQKTQELALIFVSICPEAPGADNTLPTPPAKPGHDLPGGPVTPDNSLPGGPTTPDQGLPDAPDTPDNELPDAPDRPGYTVKKTETTIHKKK